MTEPAEYKFRTLVTAGPNGFYRVVLEGTANVDEIRKAVTEVALFRDTKKEMWVLQNLHLNVSSEQLIDLAHAVKSNPYKPEKVAIVTDNDLLYGLSRMFSGFREEPGTEISVFRKVDEALEWLDIEADLPAPSEHEHKDWDYFLPGGITLNE